MAEDSNSELPLKFATLIVAAAALVTSIAACSISYTALKTQRLQWRASIYIQPTGLEPRVGSEEMGWIWRMKIGNSGLVSAPELRYSSNCFDDKAKIENGQALISHERFNQAFAPQSFDSQIELCELPDRLVNSLIKENKSLYLLGRAVYLDGVNNSGQNERITQFCVEVFDIGKKFDSKLGGEGVYFRAKHCERGNCIDETCNKEYPKGLPSLQGGASASWQRR